MMRFSSGGRIQRDRFQMRFPSTTFWIIAVASILLFPGDFRSVQVGLDPSWVYAVNFLRYTPFRFGRDVVFTYGPLGFILQPLDVGNNLLVSIAVGLLFHAIFLFVLYLHFENQRRSVYLAYFLLCYAFSFSLGVPQEYAVLLLLGLILLLPQMRIDYWSRALAAGSLLAGFVLFFKLTTGLSAIYMLGIALVFAVKSGRVTWRRALLLGPVLFSGTVVIIGISTFGGLPAFIGWITAAKDIVQGYNSAMSIPGDPQVLFVALLALLIINILPYMLWRRRSDLLFCSLLFLGPAYAAFKLGFVRQDLHTIVYFSFLVAMLAMLILASKGSVRELRRALVFSGVIFVVISPALFQGQWPDWRFVRQYMTGQVGWKHIQELVHLGQTRRRLSVASQTNLERERFPTNLLQKFGIDRHRSFDVIPWELSYLYANKLPWKPNPTLQLYSTYTQSLDWWGARHFEGRDAPDFIFLHFDAIDERNVVLDTPATWRSILRWYKPVGEISGTNLLLLRRLPSALVRSIETGPMQWVPIGQWTSVPHLPGLGFAHLRFQYSLIGRLAELAYKIPAVNLEIRLDDGSTAHVRILPETAQNGLLLTHVPLSLADLDALVRGGLPRRVVAYRLTGSGALLYKAEVAVRWTYWGPRAPDKGGSSRATKEYRRPRSRTIQR